MRSEVKELGSKDESKAKEDEPIGLTKFNLLEVLFSKGDQLRDNYSSEVSALTEPISTQIT